jgi:hypothetical protein
MNVNIELIKLCKLKINLSAVGKGGFTSLEEFRRILVGLNPITATFLYLELPSLKTIANLLFVCTNGVIFIIIAFIARMR